jgi:ATP synthase protein I
VREAKRYVRSNRAAVRNAPTVIRLDPVEAAEVARQAAIDRQRYDELKLEFQLWTLGAAALGGVTAYAVYGEDLAVSYVLGSVAGLTYLRLLSKSVDALGSSEGGGAQPRLLIPVILVLASTKWNKSYADTYGYHLELIPMLLGFFTYKFAVIGRQSLQLMTDFTADMQRQRAGRQDSSSSGSGGEGGEGEAAKPSKESELEKLFISKVWQQ